jgi:uncharacterized protein YcfL
MKKAIYAFVAITLTLAMVACGSNNTTAINVADSTAVATDSTAKVDSAAVVADSTATQK